MKNIDIIKKPIKLTKREIDLKIKDKKEKT